MNDVTGMPQTAVVIGGTSELALAVLERLAARRLEAVLLAGRDLDGLADAGRRLQDAGVKTVEVHALDVTDISAHDGLAARASAVLGPVDLVLVAAGALGRSGLGDLDPAEVARTITTNFTGAAAAMAAFVPVLVAQGAGRIVVLSSAAGVRTRKANFVYGSAKAGLDGFALGLSDALADSGVSVSVVRPGFVHTKMTAGLVPAPLAVAPDAVAREVVRGLETGATVIWVPRVLQVVFALLIHLPRALWRRLPG